MTGYDGCNVKSGLFGESRGDFRAVVTQSSNAACGHKSAIDLLELAADFEIEDKKLTFVDQDNEVVVSFTRVDLDVE